MARTKGSSKKINNSSVEAVAPVENIEKVEEIEKKIEKKVSKKVTILSKNNLKFGIYWIDADKIREFTVEEFEKHLPFCINFEEENKKGNIKIEYR